MANQSPGDAKPRLIFIAGGNGSGKSSLWEAAADDFQPGLTYLNVDDKFRELRQANPNAEFKIIRTGYQAMSRR